MEDIIKQIEILRLKHDYSKRKLAGLAGITEEYYWRIVTGRAPGCAYTIISSLCTAVGLEVKSYLSIEVLNRFEITK